MDLWQAQRVLQSASTAAVDLSGCDALSRALDVAAGEAAAAVRRRTAADRPHRRGIPALLHADRPPDRRVGGGHQAAPRRPTTRWRGCAAAVAEVDDAVRRHAALTDDLSRLADERADAAKRLTTARVAAEAVAALTQQLKQAEVVAAAADAGHSASCRRTHRAATAARRHRRANGRDRRAGDGSGASAVDELATATEVQEAAEAAAERRGRRSRPARPASMPPAARSSSCPTATRPTGSRTRLAKLDAARRELDRVERELAASR